MVSNELREDFYPLPYNLLLLIYNGLKSDVLAHVINCISNTARSYYISYNYFYYDVDKYTMYKVF